MSSYCQKLKLYTFAPVHVAALALLPGSAIDPAIEAGPAKGGRLARGTCATLAKLTGPVVGSANLAIRSMIRGL